MEIDVNPFENGMVFKTYTSIQRYLQEKGIFHKLINDDILSHYCDFHKNEDKMICIDNINEKVVPFKIRGFMYDIDQIIETKTGKIKILDRKVAINPTYKSKNINSNLYLCKCMLDGYEFELFENRISQSIGCPICGNRKVIPGFRSLYDTYPEVIKYLENPELSKEISPHSGQKVWCICPECGTRKDVYVSNLVKYGFSCDYCSDKISYPNKFIRSVLKYLGIQFVSEKSFTWSCGKIYDEYLEQFNMIIENHGIQHYSETNYFKSNLEQQQLNDKYKYELAIQNNIFHYIVIDCRESDYKWIKQSILSSDLPNILSFKEDDIDWELCDTIARDNTIIKQVCEEYNSNQCLSDLAKLFNYDNHTISKYLDIGTKCGYCEYIKFDPSKNGTQYIWQRMSKPIYCETDDIYFMSQKYCEEYYRKNGIDNFKGSYLYNYINNNKEYNGKLFKYISKIKYNELYDSYLNGDSINIYGEKYLEKFIKEER